MTTLFEFVSNAHCHSFNSVDHGGTIREWWLSMGMTKPHD